MNKSIQNEARIYTKAKKKAKIWEQEYIKINDTYTLLLSVCPLGTRKNRQEDAIMWWKKVKR